MRPILALLPLVVACAQEGAPPVTPPTPTSEPAPTAAPSATAPAEPSDKPPSAPPAERRSFELEGGALKLPEPVVFATGGAEVAAQPALEHALAYLTAKQDITLLRVEVHTDDAPGQQALSEQRAMSVARWLVSKGIDCKRLVPVGFGGTKPVADPKTPEGKAQNRRVMFVNAALRGRLIGGMPADGGHPPAGDPCR